MIPTGYHSDTTTADIDQRGLSYEGGKGRGHRRIHRVTADPKHRGTGFCGLRVPASYDTFHRKPSHLKIQETEF
jgi:hypothetical protein